MGARAFQCGKGQPGRDYEPVRCTCAGVWHSACYKVSIRSIDLDNNRKPQQHWVTLPLGQRGGAMLRMRSVAPNANGPIPCHD